MVNSITVYTLNDSGKGSLRDAILTANQNEKIKEINFNISGKISLKSDLPQILSSLTINGYNELIGLKPSIIIDGKKKYKIFSIINVANVNITFISLINSINSLYINNCKNITITNCWIGLDTEGNMCSNKSDGIEIIQSVNCVIGRNPTHDQTNFSNIISGNEKNGISIYKSKKILIQNNIIGLNSESNKIVANKLNGIFVKFSKNNIIGGNEFIDKDGNKNNPTGDKGTVPPVFVRPLLGNIISGNKANGIKLCNSDTNEVKGNFIGTDNFGLEIYPNQKCGIYIYKSSTTKILGCNTDTNPFIYYNVIGGNLYAGICTYKSKYTLVQGNFIGLGSDNSTPIPNYIGYQSKKSTDTIFGGIIPLGNVVASNVTNGFHISEGTEKFSSINTFCGNAAFGSAKPNGTNGFLIDKNAKLIKINTNVISGNKTNGIEIIDNAKDIILTSNLIGVDLYNNPMPNEGSGIVIGGNVKGVVFDIMITSIVPRNTISSNKEYGLVLKNNTHLNNITSVFIGLGYNGINYEKYTNEKGGLLITDEANNNKIGNSINALEYCYIVDKNNFAVKLTSNTSNNALNYNFINLNIQNNPVIPHGYNIIDEGINNLTFNNNVPYE